MTSRDDIEMLAGEYALGTLDASERAEVALRRLHEPALDAAIAAWQRRLAPLDELTADVTPPTELFAGIEARLETLAREPAIGRSDDDLVHRLHRHVVRWRVTALAAGALAACLAGVIVVRETVLQNQPQHFVAVFHEGDTQPEFVLSIDLRTRELTIRRVTAERQMGKRYELWIASDKLGRSPQSLGLLNATLEPTRKRLEFPPALLQNATFGVSLEPEGGSPTGRPTGTALHGKLIPAEP